MKKIIIVSFASFFVPFYISIPLLITYLSRIYYTSILAHSILLIIICSIAFSASYFYYTRYIKNKSPLFFAIVLFFWISGFSFFFHSIAIPSFYFVNEDIFDFTEHFGLFLAGLVLISLFIPDVRFKNIIYNNRKKILFFFALALISLFIFLIFSPEITAKISKYINYYIFISGLFLIAGIVAILKRRTEIAECRSFIYLVAGLSILVNAAIIPLFYAEWNILWWYFHIIILAAEIVIFRGILKKCNYKNHV